MEKELDIVEMYMSSQEVCRNEQEAKILFCDRLLLELKKMKGEDLAPYLSDIVFDKKKRHTTVLFVLKPRAVGGENDTF